MTEKQWQVGAGAEGMATQLIARLDDSGYMVPCDRLMSKRAQGIMTTALAEYAQYIGDAAGVIERDKRVTLQDCRQVAFRLVEALDVKATPYCTACRFEPFSDPVEDKCARCHAEGTMSTYYGHVDGRRDSADDYPLQEGALADMVMAVLVRENPGPKLAAVADHPKLSPGELAERCQALIDEESGSVAPDPVILGVLLEVVRRYRLDERVVLSDVDEVVVDVLVKPPEPGEPFEQKEPGTRHYFKDGVEVYRVADAATLKLVADGWVERATAPTHLGHDICSTCPDCGQEECVFTGGGEFEITKLCPRCGLVFNGRPDAPDLEEKP